MVKKKNPEENNEEQNEEKATKITDLPGVGTTTAEKLESQGYDNLMSIAVASPKELAELTGLTDVMARKIIKKARDSLDMGFKQGGTINEKRNKISTGSHALDNILDGGIDVGSITEFFGAWGSGKTQICHYISVANQLNNEEDVTVYIDTESTFRPKRIREFAKGLGIDPEKAVNRILIAKAHNSDHQMLLAEKVEELIKKGTKIKILIVDSLTAHFRVEYTGRGTLAERQQKLNKHMRTLAKIADLYGVAVLVTNQVMSNPASFFGDPNSPIGGNIVGHNSTYRVYLLRKKDGVRKAKLIDAPDLKDSECEFQIQENKITDIE